MRGFLYLGIVALFALPARGEETAEQRTLHTLTVIDSSLTREDLDTLLDDPLETVIMYATDLNYDPGAQLRAIRALPAYCETDCELVRTTLLSLIPTREVDQIQITAGRALLRLRASIEALGATRAATVSEEESDVDLLSMFLTHPSRDIRTTAVRALSTQQSRLTTPETATLRCEVYRVLLTRLTLESTPQVRIALADAVRLSDDCSTAR